MNVTTQDLEKARQEILDAIDYFRVISHTIPHNDELNRHIGRLSAISVKIASIATLQEYGG